jgi:hypothetical protein
MMPINGNGHIDFRSSVKLKSTHEFSSKADVEELVNFIRGEKVAGELVLSFPGNGGISGIIFREKERDIAAPVKII